MATKRKIVEYRSTQMDEDIKKGFGNYKRLPKMAWVTKPRFSVRDALLAVVIYGVLWFLLSHIQIHWK